MLIIKIYSFSYKKSGIPKDDSGNGGGFVFDCRFIYNPGRKDSFKDLYGIDKPVAEFLDNDKNMQEFMNNVFQIAREAVNNYIDRDFTSIIFCFGCTGGQHRSVYSAEKLGKYLHEKYGNMVKIIIQHTEFPEYSHTF